mmetsp:Transcript_43987/g.104667  ORF Transcript_43987/g.104667 Transcript_43987/m.104667 type:complete len:151 (+) Transcript_43987:137-589(+)
MVFLLKERVGKSRLPPREEGPFLPPINSTRPLPEVPVEWVEQTRAKEWINLESMQERVRQLCSTEVMSAVQVRSRRGALEAVKGPTRLPDTWTPNGKLQQTMPENKYSVMKDPKFLGLTKAKAMEQFLWLESKKPRQKKRVKQGEDMRFW